MAAEPFERDLFLCKNVDETSAGEIIKCIIKINVEDAEKEKTVVGYDRKTNPIRLHLTTRGGLLDEGFAIYDQIKCSITPIWIYTSGICCSTGFLILCAGDRRMAYPNTEIMYHQLSCGTNGRIKDIYETTEQLQKVQDKLEKCVLADTKITKAQLKKVREKKQDWYFSPDEALKYGIIDEIIQYKE